MEYCFSWWLCADDSCRQRHCLCIVCLSSFFYFPEHYFQESPEGVSGNLAQMSTRIQGWTNKMLVLSLKTCFSVMAWELISLKCLKWWGEIWHDLIFFKSLTRWHGFLTFSPIPSCWRLYQLTLVRVGVENVCEASTFTFCRLPTTDFICQACARNTYKKFLSCFLLVYFLFVLVNAWPNSRITSCQFYLWISVTTGRYALRAITICTTKKINK